METNLNNQIVKQQSQVENQIIELKNSAEGITASHALVTEIELNNGRKTAIVTLFNQRDINFEEINIGVGHTLARLRHINWVSKQSTFYRLIEGGIQYVTQFKKSYAN